MLPEPTTETNGQAPLPAHASASDAALLDGGRRTVVVSPDEVWTASEPVALAPEEVAREARRSFLAPIVMVATLSSVLLALFIVALALLVWLRR